MRTAAIAIILLFLFSQCRNPIQAPETTDQTAAVIPKKRTTFNAGYSRPDDNKISEKTDRKRDNSLSPNRDGPSKKLLPDTALYGSDRQSRFATRLNLLRSQGITPDLNESSTRDALFEFKDNEPFKSMIELSSDVILQINFDNDILNYTDRFYTNGIRIDFIAPGLQANPINRILLPYRKAAKNHYGLSLVQNMFTPSTTKTGGILYGDRPYSAYLYLGSFKITNDVLRKFRQTSEVDLGIIGPDSYGEWVQRSFHNSVPTNNEPLGWEYQVKNDLVLNYSVSLEKGLVSSKHQELILNATGNLGTLYTNISGGFCYRAGWMNPYFSNLGISNKQQTMKAGLRKFQFLLLVKGSGEIAGYDATLQGGLINRSSVYTIPTSELSRFVFKGSAGFNLSYNGFGFDIEQFFLSPEFQQGMWHKWVHMTLKFAF